MKIALASDHTGLEQIKQLEEFLTTAGHECVSYGPKTLDPDDDYPDFIRPAAEAVASGVCEVGIIMGGSGQGEAMCANRVPGARCTLFYGAVTPIAAVDISGQTSDDPYEILRLSRQHNHANMLSLAARFVSIDDMKQAVQTWLATDWDNAERHERRVQKLG
jgi:ribose 5-phosphate isomerase B